MVDGKSSENRSFHGYLIEQILTNLDEVTDKKTSNISLVKNSTYLLLFAARLYLSNSFKEAAYNSVWKQNDNMGSKSGYKRKLLSREKEESKKKKIEKSKFWLMGMRENKKNLLNYIHRNLGLNVGNSFLVILVLSDLKTVDVNR